MRRDEFDIMVAPDFWPPSVLDAMPIPTLDDYGPVFEAIRARDARTPMSKAWLSRVWPLVSVTPEAVKAIFARPPRPRATVFERITVTMDPGQRTVTVPIPIRLTVKAAPTNQRLPAKRRLHVTLSDKGWRLVRILTAMRMKRRDLETSLPMGRAVYK